MLCVCAVDSLKNWVPGLRSRMRRWWRCWTKQWPGSTPLLQRHRDRYQHFLCLCRRRLKTFSLPPLSLLQSFSVPLSVSGKGRDGEVPSLRMPQLPTRASWRKEWKRISAESSVASPPPDNPVSRGIGLSWAVCLSVALSDFVLVCLSSGRDFWKSKFCWGL